MPRTPEAFQPLPESARARRAEALVALTPFVAELGKKQLLSPENAWQPSRFIPEVRDPGERNDELQLLRDEAKNITPAVALVLAGSLITEDGLPLFTSKLGRTAPQPDSEEAQRTDAWDVWERGWAAEERRHGQLIGEYIALSGVFNRGAIERDIHRYISKGFYPKVEGDAAYGVFYVDGQEDATYISHGNESRRAKELGISHLHKGMGALSGDELRHRGFYNPVGKKLFELIPEDSMASFHRFHTDGLGMPGDTMNDYQLVVEASNAAGVYAFPEYVGVFRRMIDTYGVETIPLSGEADRMRHEVLRRQAIAEKRVERRRGMNKDEAVRNLNEMARRSEWLKPR